ncbi:hypothetical protein crov517 [Cafeteria roenbergensis virus]|uniref:Uncharacterized protein n=1 Tax=Cafeteria roenbergensis virus (strain BV-PW1) TaxID=693272 RepID=E3T5T8_CROVB|nr:hypothetical protein crov517 [Cafeteria roenbergensis virus BV-PW1]ADO67551.1 hypothetical protein crov517 [Cafeteria roenbergensis virus BV-PW1]
MLLQIIMDKISYINMKNINNVIYVGKYNDMNTLKSIFINYKTNLGTNIKIYYKRKHT